MNLLAQVLLLCATLLLALLAVEAVAAMPRRGAWLSFALWSGVGVAALTTAASVHDVPLPVGVLLLVLSVLLWSQRRRIVWAASHGRAW